MQPVEEFVSQREAARRFGIAPDTLRRRVRDGRLRTYFSPLDDRSMLFRVADLESLRIPRPLTTRKEEIVGGVR